MKIATSTERIKELLDADSRSLTTIAKELGVSKQAVSSWKTGVRTPKLSVLLKIADSYHVSIEWLMGFDVDRYGEDRSLFIPDTDMFRKILFCMTPEDYKTVLEIFERTEIRMRAEGKL